MKRCKVMGIVNVTPDSFSDGGKFFKSEEAVRRARNMIDEGVDVLDLGGESTRPGATPLGWEEEWARLEPVVLSLRDCGVPLSVDTYHPETAAKALALGVKIVNCVYSEPIPEMLRLLDRYPEAELVAPVKAFPNDVPERVILDPMIGFDTTREEDLELLQNVSSLAKRGRLLIGASRKRIVKKLTGTKVPGKDLAGNLTIALWSALQGADYVRVHDVRETVQALKVLNALAQPVRN